MSDTRPVVPVETNADGVVMIFDPKPQRPVSARGYRSGNVDVFAEQHVIELEVNEPLPDPGTATVGP